MIRQFQPGDSNGCAAVVQASVVHDGTISRSLRQRLLSNESGESMLERARLYYLAVFEINGSIAGFAGLDMNEIRILVVDPQYRGRNVGRDLLEHLETMVPAALFQDIFVYSSRAAVGFYRNCGYKSRGEYDLDVD